jgi:hypothetical protein
VCGKSFLPEKYRNFPKRKFGKNLISWVFYQKIDQRQTNKQIANYLEGFFGLPGISCQLSNFLMESGEYYRETYLAIIKEVLTGDLLHADETGAKVRHANGYVWVFTNMEAVFYMYKQNREGDFLPKLLQQFKGVLVSDFYSAYDSLPCAQQKCLIHLIRDLNDDLLKNPFDEGYKKIIDAFSSLLRTIVGTIDRYGLKKRHLHKHKEEVGRFFREIVDSPSSSELVLRYQKKFRKYEQKLFTFLDHDGIPWNNNNAERAVKGYVMFRKNGDGLFSEKSIEMYLILLSIQQTCRFKNVNFFDFLRSGEKDVREFLVGKDTG